MMSTTVVEISDNEDADDDCVMNCDIIVVDDEPESELYQEMCKENQLLANFIERCLQLENSRGMQKVLREKLIKNYYEADKTARESSRIQKNLRRANYLLQTDPNHKFTHIKDLGNILQAIKAKKRVPFVTLSTNLTDNNCRSDTLKRSSTEKSEVSANGICKKAKLDEITPEASPFSESNNTVIFNNNDTVDDSMNLITCSQQSAATEEDRLLVPHKESVIVPMSMEKKLKAIDSKISFYKKRIAALDEQEVDDDSVNSAYIKCERLKIKIVSLYKERCQLIGSQPVQHKGIRLKLAEGRPAGPTKVLERFLNKNCNKDGDPPFPDFCDVVTCVTEANEKDDLGWTKAQIMNEASALFTLCGRALQKRRQNREYRDLLYKVKMEEIEKDPADEDPLLRAKLEENKRIAMKKESDILERYTMLQLAAPQSKSQKSITTDEKSSEENDGVTNIADTVNAEPKEIQDNSHLESIVLSTDEEESNHGTTLKYSSTSGIDKSNFNVDSESTVSKCSDVKGIDRSCLNEVTKTQSFNDSWHVCTHMGTGKGKENSSLQQIIETKGANEYCNEKNCDTIIHNKVTSHSAGHENKPDGNNDPAKNNNDDKLQLDKLNNSNNKMDVESTQESIHKSEGDVINMFKSLGDNFTVSVEILSDS